ncbi:MAG: hypothetical protein EZS28_006492 [Streblomastix strix]|uniref:Uncharacterized protein n=1 Tax=Streblomastix strix TaxID=222440 RepID=A0A5J4WSR1_9EUKA|nr:MAG: hypothetical protein EZS28_006492 [Streblomastix strix]
MYSCEVISILLDDNMEAIQYALMKNGIIDNIFSMISILPHKQLQFFHLLPIYSLFKTNSLLISQAMLERGFLQLLKLFLNSQSENVLMQTTYCIYQFFFNQSILENKQQLNQLREQIQKQGSLEKLIEIFRNDAYQNQKIYQNIALAIGFLYKASPIPTSYGSIIIDFLKQLSCQMNSPMSVYALFALSHVAECKDNHPLIYSGIFIAEVNDILHDNERESLLQNSLYLLTLMFMNGGNISQKYPDGSIQPEVKQILINEKQAFNHINKVIEDVLDQDILWMREQLSHNCCEVAYFLLEGNPDSVDVALQDNGIIDHIIEMIERVSDVQIDHLKPVTEVSLLCNPEQWEIMQSKNGLDVLIRAVSSQNEDVIFESISCIERICYQMGVNEVEGKQNIMKDYLEQDGVMQKFIEIATSRQDKYQNYAIVQCAALIISHLYKAAPLPEQFGKIVTDILKQQLSDPEDDVYPFAIQGLGNLVECNDLKVLLFNHEEEEELQEIALQDA